MSTADVTQQTLGVRTEGILTQAVITINYRHENSDKTGPNPWYFIGTEHIATLADVLKEMGYELTEIRRLWSTQQAADYFGINTESVRKKLTRAGIPHVDTRGWPADDIEQRWPKEEASNATSV